MVLKAVQELEDGQVDVRYRKNDGVSFRLAQVIRLSEMLVKNNYELM